MIDLHRRVRASTTLPKPKRKSRAIDKNGCIGDPLTKDELTREINNDKTRAVLAKWFLICIGAAIAAAGIYGFWRESWVPLVGLWPVAAVYVERIFKYYFRC